jgi:hypothetical protein
MITLRFLARMFTEGPQHLSSAKAVARVSEILGADDLELEAQGRLNLTTGLLVQASNMSSAKGGWNVVSQPDSIDLEFIPTSDDNATLSFADFLKRCETFAELALQKTNARRLAVLRERLMPQVSKEQCATVGERLIRFPTFAEGRPTNEWDWRCVADIRRSFAGLTENTKTIATIRRQSGTFLRNSQPFDGFRVDLDINTDGASSEPRFTKEHAKAFFSESAKWHEDLESEVWTFAGLPQ